MLTSTIEALIFASGEGMTKEEIAHHFSAEYTTRQVYAAIDEVVLKYSDLTGGILIKIANGKIQMLANPAYGEKISECLQIVKERQLSKVLLQCLAIVAYKQPITRMEIAEIRKTNCDYAVGALEGAGLIYKSGQKNTLGRPFQYSTTDEFLKKFGLETLEDLPDYEELLMKIRNDFDKLYNNSETLYRNRNIMSEEEVAALVDADLANGLEFFESEEEGLEFLEGEDVIEIE